MHLVTAGTVIVNMLKSHTAAYHAIKALPGGAAAQVGFVHHHITYAVLGDGMLFGFAK